MKVRVTMTDYYGLPISWAWGGENNRHTLQGGDVIEVQPQEDGTVLFAEGGLEYHFKPDEYEVIE
jgi:hypothetical protein